MDQEQKRMKKGGPLSITTFTNNLQVALRAQCAPGNFVYSPLGVGLLMGMTQVGSRGNTALEITQALSFPQDEKVMLKDFSQCLSSIKSEQSESFTLRTSQRVFIDKGYPVNPEYLEKLVRNFDAGIRQMDFTRGNPKHNAAKINKWVNEATEGKIETIVTEETLQPCPSDPLRLLLIGTVYFHGKWSNPFEAANTDKSPFYANSREPWDSIEVDMMHSSYNGMRKEHKFEYVYLEKLDAEVVKLPYKGGRFSMVIFVPKFRHGLDKVEQGILNISVGKYLAKLKKYKKEMDENGVLLYVSLPKFKIETDVDLKGSLKTLGINDAFKLFSADFTKISEHPEGLYIKDIMQRAIIEVDELGTTAAAVTRLTLSGGGGNPEMIHVEADRSFYFQIVDEKHELAIFSGVVIDPTKTV